MMNSILAPGAGESPLCPNFAEAARPRPRPRKAERGAKTPSGASDEGAVAAKGLLGRIRPAFDLLQVFLSNFRLWLLKEAVAASFHSLDRRTDRA